MDHNTTAWLQLAVFSINNILPGAMSYRALSLMYIETLVVHSVACSDAMML